MKDVQGAVNDLPYSIPEPDREAWSLLPNSTLLVGFRGSVVHGTYRPPKDPESVDDVDVMAVHMGPLEHYLGFRRKSQETIDRSEGRWDVVSYEVRHYISLLKKNNPNVMQLLWLPDEFVLEEGYLGRRLRESRSLFLSKKAYHAFNGYAWSQFKKLEKKDHRGYVGEKRKALVAKHGYDTKYASHLVRLLRTGVEYLRDGRIEIPRPDADELLRIKRGDLSLSEVREIAMRGFDDLKEARDGSALPDRPHDDAIEGLLMEVIREFYGLG